MSMGITRKALALISQHFSRFSRRYCTCKSARGSAAHLAPGPSIPVRSSDRSSMQCDE